jgi:hypothetical protein
MFYKILKKFVIYLFIWMVFFSIVNKVKADLYYDTYQGTGARPSFPGNGGSLTYPTKLSSGTVSSLNHNWGGGVVLDSGRSQQVIVHFYGYITIPDTGSQDIQFYLYADDGVYMKIDSTVVINDWNEQAAGTWNYISTDQTLTGGSTYYIDAWWYENGGGASIKLYWDQSGSVALVPASTYSLTEPTPTYSSSITSAQQTIVDNTRNITSNSNAIYIDQAGDNLDLDIVQYDNDNLVAGTASTSSTIADAVISGDDNTVSITQGNNAGSVSDNNVVLMGVNGNNNNLTVRQGDNVDDAGDSRLILDVTGNYNTVGVLQENDGMGVSDEGHFMSVDVDGNSNIMYMDQKDDGDKIMFVDINGSSNDIDLIQQGTGEHFLDVTAGSNQTIDVNQDGSGNMSATIDMSGYSSTLDLDQTGSTDQTYSLTQNCVNVNGCGTTTVTQN